MANQHSGVQSRTPEEVEKRRAFVVKCRIKCISYEKIRHLMMQELGYHVTIAQLNEDFRAAMRLRNKEQKEDVDLLRRMALDRHEQVIEAIWDRVLAGSVDHIEQYIKLEQRLAKLFGFDAPTKTEVKDVTNRPKLTEAELLRRMTAIGERILDAQNKGRVLSPGAVSFLTRYQGLQEAVRRDVTQDPRNVIDADVVSHDPELGQEGIEGGGGGAGSQEQQAKNDDEGSLSH